MRRLTTSLLLAGSLVIFTGCEKNLDIAAKPKIDMTLPVVNESSVKTISDIRSIALEWKSIAEQNTNGYYIYRSNMQKDGQKFKRVANIKNKYTTHYLDKDLESNSKYAYTVAVVGNDGAESNPSKPVIAMTLPNFDSVSLIDTISDLPRQIKILWRPHSSPRVESYIIERTTPVESEWKEIATIEDRYNVEYIDEKLGDNEIYLYRIKAVTFDDIVSNPSAISKAATRPLPKGVTSLTATKDLPRQIQLSWERSVTKNVVYYNIYRSDRFDGIFSKLTRASVDHNRFDDVVNDDGKVYFYKITSVDKDGLETNINDISSVMGSTLSKPMMPQLTLAQIQGNKIILNWVAGDNRAVSYNIFKSVKKGWSSFDTQLIPNINDLRFEDHDVVRGVEYKYSIQAVDEHGLVSIKTKDSSLTLPKLPQQEQ